jgi:hypothetical protein
VSDADHKGNKPLSYSAKLTISNKLKTNFTSWNVFSVDECSVTALKSQRSVLIANVASIIAFAIELKKTLFCLNPTFPTLSNRPYARELNGLQFFASTYGLC